MKLSEVREDGPDVITIDVPLFIRLLEWAREDAADDAQLHVLAEKAIELSQRAGPVDTRVRRTLKMVDYAKLVPTKK